MSYDEFVALETLNLLRRIIGKEYFKCYSYPVDLHFPEYLAFLTFHTIHDSGDVVDIVLVVSF